MYDNGEANRTSVCLYSDDLLANFFFETNVMKRHERCERVAQQARAVYTGYPRNHFCSSSH